MYSARHRASIYSAFQLNVKGEIKCATLSMALNWNACQKVLTLTQSGSSGRLFAFVFPREEETERYCAWTVLVAASTSGERRMCAC